jgi:hypothetical protein
MVPELIPTMICAPLAELVSETLLPWQTRSSPPRSRRTLVFDDPAVTEEPLISRVLAAESITAPLTVASEE